MLCINVKSPQQSTEYPKIWIRFGCFYKDLSFDENSVVRPTKTLIF